MKKLITVLLVCALFSGSAYASGFQLNEQGARAMAMAGAFTGLANDASALYFNPAGITQLNGTQIYAGVSLIMPIGSFSGPSPATTKTDMASQVFTPINFNITHQLSDKFFAGFSVNNQYGLGTKWDENWVGRYFAVETKVTTFFFTPVVAYKITDDFSISAGPTIAIGSVKITKKTPNQVSPLAPEFLTTMDGDSKAAFGFTAGLLYKFSPQFQVGVSYRSQTKFDFTGTAVSTPASFTFVHPQAGQMTIPWPNGDISASLTTPQNVTVGLAFIPSKEFTTTLDFQYVGWSSYDVLAVTFANYNPASANFKGTYTTSSPRNYKDSFIIRGGAEYVVSDGVTLRGGLLYDQAPVPDDYVDATLPDNNRIGINIGVGFKLSSNLGVDLSYMLLTFGDRTIPNDSKVTAGGVPAAGVSSKPLLGTYSNVAHLFGINFSYSL